MQAAEAEATATKRLATHDEACDYYVVFFTASNITDAVDEVEVAAMMIAATEAEATASVEGASGAKYY